MIEHRAMLPVLTFKRSSADREVALLGDDVVVGQITDVRGSSISRFVWLPDTSRGPAPAGSVAEARDALQKAVEFWLVRIGVFYPGQSIEVRVQ